MIKAEHANKQPSERILRRSSGMKARLLQQFEEGETVTEVEIESDDENKAPNIVSFHQRDGEIFIACFKKNSLVGCRANTFNVFCSHVERAIKLLLETKGELNGPE